MTSERLQLSVIIPTTDRVPSLERTLVGLARQDVPTGSFEVIVSVDGDYKSTISYLSAYNGPLKLRHIQHPAAGAAAARNRGAAVAAASWLLFLDDDVEPAPGLLQAHFEASSQAAALCLGRLQTEMPHPLSFLAAAMLGWWEDKFFAMQQQGHRSNYTDMLSAHFSIASRTFNGLQGFDEAFKCREDYEFGARALKEGIPIRFLNQALGVHHERPDLGKLLRQSQAEGIGDVQLARKHPELFPYLRLAKLQFPTRKIGWTPRGIRRWAFQQGRFWEKTLPWLERFHLRHWWRKVLVRVAAYYYLAGVRSECRDSAAFKALGGKSPKATLPNPMLLDLAAGFQHLEAQIEREAPAAVELACRGLPVGLISRDGIAEPLRIPHLRKALRESHGYSLLVATSWDILTRPRN